MAVGAVSMLRVTASGEPDGFPSARSRAQEPHAPRDASWTAPLRAVDRALDGRDANGALRAWDDAHLAAVESTSWEGLIAAGHARLRIGRTLREPTAAETAARRAFFAALYRACRENSFEGIVRSAEAFRTLGDRDVVEECVGLAELLADGDETRRRLAELVVRLRSGGAPEPGADRP
jgi:hypothetical protein